MNSFGERLKMLRKTKKIKQTDMAVFLEITPRHYQDMEYGKINVPALTLIALADYFDVSLDYLVGRSDDPARR
jgi:transcriptional regulator with XRE-family HTH domain